MTPGPPYGDRPLVVEAAINGANPDAPSAPQGGHPLRARLLRRGCSGRAQPHRDCPLPWSVAVVGGDLFATDLPELALARGGHLRVGLEDHGGRRASNQEPVAQAVDAVRASGREVADCATAAAFLGLAARD